MINISKYLDDCLVKYSNYKPSKKNKKSFIEGNEENFKVFIQKILEFNDVYKRQKNMKKKHSDKPKKKGKYSVNDLESDSADVEASEEESEKYDQKNSRNVSKAKKSSLPPLKSLVGKKSTLNTSAIMPTRGQIEITKTGLGGVQSSKFVPSRSSKTDCLNKIMQSQFMKKKKSIGLRKADSKKEFSNEANLVAKYLDENEEESYGNSHLEAQDTHLKQRPSDTNEFILPNDDYGDIHSENGDSSAQKDNGKKNLKIMIPQVTYKYIKDAMFPDSKVKDEKFLRSPYPPPEFGRTKLTEDEKYFKESVSMISPMVSKKGGIFLGLNFSRSL